MAAANTVRTARSTRARARAVGWATLALGLSLVTVGCGGAARPAARAQRARSVALSPPCSASARRALARSSGIAVDSVLSSPFTASGGEASCRFSARERAAGALEVVAELDGAPQAYYRLDREVVEFDQNVIWAHLGARADPYPIPHLGLAADWFPSENQLVTTDGVRLITIFVTSVPAGAGGDARVAASLARTYLGPLASV